MGYATEAARRALQAAYEDHGWTTAASVIAVANVASAALAERLGATIESEQQNRYGPVHVYRHIPPTSIPPTSIPPTSIPPTSIPPTVWSAS